MSDQPARNGDRNRKGNGRFRKGCRPGPGRPRRKVELEYLATLSDAVPLKVWRKICAKAVEQALDGNHQARVFLAKYLVGESGNLLELAARESLSQTAADEIKSVANNLAEARQREGNHQ